MKKILLIMVAYVLVAGCAAQKPLTPEQIAAERDRQLNMITRVYPDKTPEEILVAADQIFRLADDDYETAHSPNSLQAKRNWLMYLVIAVASGSNNWLVTTEELPEGGTKVVTSHSAASSSFFGMPVATSTGGTSATGATTPTLQNITTDPALYGLFYARMDYLLGKRPDWVTCKDAEDLFPGNLEAFCTVATDRTPDGLAASQRRRETENK